MPIRAHPSATARARTVPQDEFLVAAAFIAASGEAVQMGEDGVGTERVGQVLGQALAAADRLAGPTAGEALNLNRCVEWETEAGGHEPQAVGRQFRQFKRPAAIDGGA